MAATKQIADLPTPRGRLPVLGNVRELLDATQAHIVYERWADELGPLYRVGMPFTRDTVVVAGHDLIGDVLRARPEAFTRWSRMHEVFTEITQLIDGVFFAEGPEWKQQRTLVNAALNMRHLQRYFELVHISGIRLARCLEEASDGRSFDITQLFYRYTVDTTSAIALGHDLNTLERGQAPLQRGLELMFSEGMKRMFAPVPYWRWFPTKADRRLRAAIGVLETELHAYLRRGRERIAARPELLEEPENALDAMLAAQHHEARFTDEQILSNINVLLTAGEDTTANTLGWATWYLATRPELQARLADEADAAFAGETFPTSHDTVDRLVVADAVIRETLRLRSVAPLSGLESAVDTEIDGVRIPKGTVVMALARYVAHGTGPDAEDFRPDRWLDGAAAPPKTYAFGGGPRFCPGRNLALAEAKSALALLCRTCEFTLDTTSEVRQALHFTLVPEGVRIHLRPRVGVPA